MDEEKVENGKLVLKDLRTDHKLCEKFLLPGARRGRRREDEKRNTFLDLCGNHDLKVFIHFSLCGWMDGKESQGKTLCSLLLIHGAAGFINKSPNAWANINH